VVGELGDIGWVSCDGKSIGCVIKLFKIVIEGNSARDCIVFCDWVVDVIGRFVESGCVIG